MSVYLFRTPQLTRICLRVRDPRRSVDFYRAVLRLEDLCTTRERGDNRAGIQHSREDGCDFEIVFVEGLPPGDHLAGLDRVGFEVLSRDQVDRIYDAAIAQHARATRPRFYGGVWQTFVFDPDDYKIEVFTQAE